MLQPVWWLLLVAMLIAVAIYFARNIWGKGASVDGGAPMPQERVVLLTAYLLIVGSALVFMLVSLNSLDFPATPVIPQEAPIPTPTPTPTPVSGSTTAAAGATTPAAPQVPTPSPTPVVPILLRIFPQVALGSAPNGTPNPKLAIYGKNFTEASKVRLNLRSVAVEYLSDNLIRVPLEASDLIGKGAITVDVQNADGAVSNAIPVPIEKPEVKLNVFFVAYPVVTREVQLLLLVILAGALGSYLHAIMSLADYIAKRQITASWFWWYISRPFLGMAMALVFYAVLRGGFLAGTPADANVVNPFGVLTIGRPGGNVFLQGRAEVR